MRKRPPFLQHYIFAQEEKDETNEYIYCMFWELPENQFIRANTYLTWVNRPCTGQWMAHLGKQLT